MKKTRRNTKIIKKKGKKSNTINKKASKRSYRRSNRRRSNRRRSNRRRSKASKNSIKSNNKSKRYKQYNKKRVYKRNFIIKGGNPLPTLQDIEKIQEHINTLLILINRENRKLDKDEKSIIAEMKNEVHKNYSALEGIDNDEIYSVLRELQISGQAIYGRLNLQEAQEARKARLEQMQPEPEPEPELQEEQKLTPEQLDIIKTKIRTKMEAKKKSEINQLLHDWWKCLLYYRFLLMDDDDDEIPPPFLEYLYDLYESWRGWSPEEKLQFSGIMEEAFYESLRQIDVLTMPEDELREEYVEHQELLKILIDARDYYQEILSFRSSLPLKNSFNSF